LFFTQAAKGIPSGIGQQGRVNWTSRRKYGIWLNILTTVEIKSNWLLYTDSEGNSDWRRSALEGKLYLLKKICDFAKDILTTKEIKSHLFYSDSEGNTLRHCAALDFKLDLFQKILDLAKTSVN
jgi:hypothetical protein